MESLELLFKPKSVAIIGVSHHENKWGYITLKTLIESGYNGQIYPINPKGGDILGLKVYTKLIEVNDHIDIAFCSLPAEFIRSVVIDSTKKRVGYLVVYTSGFAERGDQGAILQKEIVEIARKGGTRIVGPNCMGIFSACSNLNLTGLPPPAIGGLALVAQSGNLGLEMFHEARRRNIGFSIYVSVGNQADIQFHEYLRYLKDDPLTKAIMLYMEGLQDGRAFLECTKEVVKVKPIICIKAGTSDAARRSALSHTASLTGDDEIYNGVFRQSGIIRLDSCDEMLDIAYVLASLTPPNANRVALIGGGGGHATMLSDSTEKYGLQIPTFRQETQEKLKNVLFERSSVKNPVDFAGSSDDNFTVYEKCTKICMEDDDINGIIIYGVFGGYNLNRSTTSNSYENSAQEIVRLVQKYKKPLIIHSIYAQDNLKTINFLWESKIPVYGSIDLAAKAMGLLYRYRRYRERNIGLENKQENNLCERKCTEIIEDNSALKREWIFELEARKILERVEIPLCPMFIGHTENELVKSAQQIGYPVVLKVLSQNIIHKTEYGGVILNIQNEYEMRAAYRGIVKNIHEKKKDLMIDTFSVSPFLEKRTEVIIGFSRDDVFGPVIMLGLGGIFVEVLRDLSFRVAPLEKSECYEMIKEIKAYKVLAGIRGQSPKNVESIVDILLKISALALDNTQIIELDLNPILVSEKDAMVVDVRMLGSLER